jgi:hypothetical protein
MNFMLTGPFPLLDIRRVNWALQSPLGFFFIQPSARRVIAKSTWNTGPMPVGKLSVMWMFNFGETTQKLLCKASTYMYAQTRPGHENIQGCVFMKV